MQWTIAMKYFVRQGRKKLYDTENLQATYIAHISLASLLLISNSN